VRTSATRRWLRKTGTALPLAVLAVWTIFPIL
jgi:hypothetical protein